MKKGGPLHPIVKAAARGELPEWAAAGGKRRAHMDRVAGLLRRWALERGMGKRNVTRWTAVGYLHDVLREAHPDDLRPLVDPSLRDLPDRILHGPAAAVRLRAEGVKDEDLLWAVSYHTVGHPGLKALGRALYAADFLEPGRAIRKKWRAALRERMPGELKLVVREIVRARIENLLRRGMPVRPETVEFWNSLAPKGGR